VTRPNQPWPLGTTTLRERTAVAVADPVLRRNVATAADRFASHRVATFDRLHDPEGLRRAARGVRGEVLAQWAEVLEQLADNVLATGGHVCWAADGAAANRYIAEVAARIGARTAVKSKSMATEETGLNEALAAAGCEVVETDLGEWIIQLAGEHPSHIIAPAVHRNRDQIADTFEAEAGMPERTTEPTELVAFARGELRRRFLEADLGITGANLGVAETGSVVLVTNEGNGRMVTCLPRVHVAVLGAERVVRTWDQADLVLGLLAKAATGQLLSTYTSITTGPRQQGEVDGPDEFHLVILDNGRSDIAGTEFAEMLNCIRCGSCLNVCPVYRQTGGHAYGWVYSGPMGAVLTPLLAASEPNAAELGSASSLCGACRQACPVDIPLPDLLLALRRRKAAAAPAATKAMWKTWAAAWSRPAAYRATGRLASRGRRLAPLAARLPVAKRWTDHRAMPDLPARTFTDRWKAGEV
jgi:L-lactate dehydrogenase complex protein LldF